jgi:hypothetical protein
MKLKRNLPAKNAKERKNKLKSSFFFARSSVRDVYQEKITRIDEKNVTFIDDYNQFLFL